MDRTLDWHVYDTDKIHGYMAIYDRVFQPFADRPIKLLELGVRTGGSLRLWRDYFPDGTIVGLDVNPIRLSDSKRIYFYQGAQEDTALLTRIAQEMAPDGFDIIIDDASHVGDLTRMSFWHLFDNHLKPGGLYAIEDWGTGYWDTWPDGRSYRPRSRLRAALLRILSRIGVLRRVGCHTHSFGMVGLVKELIDEQGFEELSRKALGQEPLRPSKFKSVLVTGKVVVVIKAETGGQAFRLSE